MADLAAVTECRMVYSVEAYTLPAGEAITAGQLVGMDSNGKLVKADADTGPIYTKGIAVGDANQAGLPVTFVVKGLVDCGDVFTGTALNASVFSSGTAGLMADAAVGGLAAIGVVWPAWGYPTTADKLLKIGV